MTLVLMNPVGLGAGSWDRVDVPADAVRHEFPGFGRRPRAAEPPTMASLADEVAASYDGPLDVVGVSMGGMVAQHVAVRHPDRVRSVVVCTGAAANPDAMRDRAAAVEAVGMAGVLDETLARWFTPAALEREPEHPGVAHARATLLALEPSAFADGWRAIAGHDVRERLPEIAVPLTCIAGASDAASPVARSQEIADRVAAGRLVVLEGPHMIHLECPDPLSAALREHLARVEAA